MIASNKYRQILSQREVPLAGFHDCHVRGLSWNVEYFSFALQIGYIMKWIKPSFAGGSYKFLVCPAELIFENADGVCVSLNWTDSILDAEIEAIKVVEQRTTSNGAVQYLFETAFSNPDGNLRLWATGYSVGLLGDAVETTVPGKW
jgi:hypothetical protein